MRMTQLAIEDNKSLKASAYELDRPHTLNYTSETLSALVKENVGCQYFFIIGADSLYMIENWYHPELIFQSASILVAVRNSATEEDVKTKMEELKQKYNARLFLLHIPHIDISSRMIREKIKMGQSIKYYVPKDVEKYIYQNSLYKD
jgi:nicotinate-nucleotide adenylyltransferase